MPDSRAWAADRWRVCAARWLQAYRGWNGPPRALGSVREASTLEVMTSLELLRSQPLCLRFAREWPDHPKPERPGRRGGLPLQHRE
jgi:hypothetical protein